MKYHRLDLVDTDPRYAFVKMPLPVGAEMTLAEPAMPKMEKLGLDALDLPMDEDMGGLELSDSVSNASNHVALRRACIDAILKDHDIGEHELLPCRLINEKGRVHADDYVLINLLGKVDCLDQQHSELDTNVDFLHVAFMGKWSLEAAKIPPGRDLFRADGVLGHIFSDRLVQFIADQGFTNFAFEPVVVT